MEISVEEDIMVDSREAIEERRSEMRSEMLKGVDLEVDLLLFDGVRSVRVRSVRVRSVG